MSYTGNQHAGTTNVDRSVLNFFKYKLNCKSMIDVGCGLGGQVERARLLDIDAYGIDGDAGTIPQEDYYTLVDYREGSSDLEGPFDFAWSCEFAEHIEEDCIANFMGDFKKCKYVVFCAAPPGWGGVNHINEQPEEYWIDKFDEYGFKYEESLTEQVRNVSDNLRRDKKQFMRNRGLVFRNED